MRAIDADDFKEMMRKNFGNLPGIDAMEKIIDMQPTLHIKADVDFGFCKDCLYWTGYVCGVHDLMRDKAGYCSDFKKGGEENG